MAPKRSKYPSQRFFHLGVEFVLTAVPDGADVEIQIADQYGRFLPPFSLVIFGANARGRRDDNRRRVDAGMAKLQKVIQALDEARFLKFLEIPRAASDFDWTPEELDAAAKINWSYPVVTFVHEKCRFSIAAFETDRRLVFLLRDADGPFDEPMSMPREMIERAELKGDDPLLFGVKAMVTQIRSWTTSRTAAFVRDAPRLADRMQSADRRSKGQNTRH